MSRPNDKSRSISSQMVQETAQTTETWLSQLVTTLLGIILVFGDRVLKEIDSVQARSERAQRREARAGLSTRDRSRRTSRRAADLQEAGGSAERAYRRAARNAASALESRRQRHDSVAGAPHSPRRPSVSPLNYHESPLRNPLPPGMQRPCCIPGFSRTAPRTVVPAFVPEQQQNGRARRTQASSAGITSRAVGRPARPATPAPMQYFELPRHVPQMPQRPTTPPNWAAQFVTPEDASFIVPERQSREHTLVTPQAIRPQPPAQPIITPSLEYPRGPFPQGLPASFFSHRTVPFIFSGAPSSPDTTQQPLFEPWNQDNE